MKEIISDRLNTIEDLQQRKLLRNVMNDVFSNLIQQNTKMYQDLEKRVFNEIDTNEEQYDIWIGLCNKEEVDPIHPFLYPMCSEDIQDYDIGSLKEAINEEEDVILFTVFMECDYLIIQQIQRSNEQYKGMLITDVHTHPIEVYLQPSKKYNNRIESLYHIFQENQIPWRTLNNPYANKFFDVVLRTNGLHIEDEKIKEVSVQLGEYDQYKRVNMLLLWNIQQLSIKNASFPMPAQDKIHFEHMLSIKELGVQNGYLVDIENEDVSYIRRTDHELIIISPEERAKPWDIIKVCKPAYGELDQVPDHVVSNEKKTSFLGKYVQNQMLVIRTFAEISRLIYSFVAFKTLHLESIKIQDVVDQEETYDLNPFIMDNVRDEDYKKFMCLYFRSDTKDSFIKRDQISFAVSEVQMYFPEYRCMGILL